MSDRLAFIDLDGVIADERHRVHHALAREWGTYFSAELMRLDGVFRQGRELYENCILAGFDIAYLTGRREDTRPTTKRWLKRNGFDHKLPLIMRKLEDRRPLAKVKAGVVWEALEFGYDEVYLYDDDPYVIEEVRQVTGARGRHCTWHIKPERMVRRQVA